MTEFTIETKSSGDYTGEYATNSPNELNNATRGDSATFVLEIDGLGELNELVVASGDTYQIVDGDSETYESADIDGTLDLDGRLVINANAAESIFQYDEYAGKYTLMETIDSSQPYREFLPDSIGIDTNLVGIRPSNDLQSKQIDGVWGLISDISDSRNQPLTTDRITITVDILAQYDEYSNHTAVENELLV